MNRTRIAALSAALLLSTSALAFIPVYTPPGGSGSGGGGVTSVPHGGTADTTLTAHGVLIGAGTSPVAVTGAGTSGYVLTSNGASADPTFQAASGGALTAAAVRTAVNTDRFYFDIPASATGLYSYIRASPQPAGNDDGIAFEILSGDGGTTDGIGGDIVFGAGRGYGSDGAGGIAWLSGGPASGSAAGGTVVIQAGTSVSGHGGAVQIAPGLSDSGTNGDLIIANIKTTDSLITESWFNDGGVLRHTGTNNGLNGSGATFKINGILAMQNTAPTLSGCGGSATVTNNAGSLSFNYSVGTAPPTTCTITLPTASHGWHCVADDITTATEVLHQTGVSTTTCVMTYYAITTGLATAPTASNNILVTATAY